MGRLTVTVFASSVVLNAPFMVSLVQASQLQAVAAAGCSKAWQTQLFLNRLLPTYHQHNVPQNQCKKH
jgi:hypothetical protein